MRANDATMPISFNVLKGVHVNKMTAAASASFGQNLCFKFAMFAVQCLFTCLLSLIADGFISLAVSCS